MQQSGKRVGAKVGAVILVGVVAGLIVTGEVRIVGGSAAQASPGASRTGPPPLRPRAAPLRVGPVVADDAVASLTTEVSLGGTATSDGAVAAFTSYAVWLIGSPAAVTAPADALRVVGPVNAGDAHLLSGMQRGPGDRFVAGGGAYRVLGYSGDEKHPTEVMIEVTGRLTLAGRTRWVRVGGVVGWTPAGWRLVSIRPQSVSQPAVGRVDVSAFSAAEKARTLAGLGWQAFAPARVR